MSSKVDRVGALSLISADELILISADELTFRYCGPTPGVRRACGGCANEIELTAARELFYGSWQVREGRGQG